MSGAQQAVEQILGDGRAGHAGQGLGGHTFTDDLTLEEVQGLLDLLGIRRVQGLDGQVVAYDLFCPGAGRLAEGVVAHQVEGLDGELEQVVVTEDLGLLDERLFHLVEGVDVGLLPPGGLLAGESHAEEGEAVAGHAECGFLPLGPFGPQHGLDRGRKIALMKLRRAIQIADRAQNILVLLAEVFGDVEAGRGGFAADDLDADLGGGLGFGVGNGLAADVAHVVSPLVIVSSKVERYSYMPTEPGRV